MDGMKWTLIWGESVAVKMRPEEGHTQTSFTVWPGSMLVYVDPVCASQICTSKGSSGLWFSIALDCRFQE
jgi:hypothetical protein